MCALRRIAKRAGRSLADARLLLLSASAGSPACASLRELAARKLPEVEALIARAEAMQAWLLTATDCSCSSLDVCALFEPGSDHAPRDAQPREPLRITHVQRADPAR